MVAVLIIWPLLPAASLTFGLADGASTSLFVDGDGNISAAASGVLGAISPFILSSFNPWHIYLRALFIAVCPALAIWPASGRVKLGLESDKPEFSKFFWFSMMFGAGIGIGMLTFATAKPIYHWASYPATIQWPTDGSTAGCVRDAFIWSFIHWGIAAWAFSALVSLALA